MPDQIIICDASPLIAFADIGELELFNQLYGQVFITDIVREEVHAQLPEWIVVTTEYDSKRMELLQLELDAGEASAIALGLEIPDCTLILDESKGRSVAKRLGLKFTGSVGIIIKAKEKGIIESGKKLLSALSKHGFWLSPQLTKQIIKRLGEE